jgi:ribose transport system ATP-binding protein
MDFLRVEGLTKRFGGVLALDGIDLTVGRGEIHSIVGENGAGKSTLLKIVSGILKADGGELFFEGDRITNEEPTRLFDRGISAAFQETSLCGNLTVAENLFLGRLYRHRGAVINWHSAAEEAGRSLEGFGIPDVDPKTKVSGLSPETRQMLEIIKSVKDNAKLISLDEPTASLTKEGVGLLFRLLERLKAQGITILYVSHHLDEVLELSDRITVFRDGRKVGTIERAEASEGRLHEMMIGRAITHERRRGREAVRSGRQPVLRVDGVGDGDAVKEVSFEVFEGEVLGVTGLVGAGRSELAWLLFGLAPKNRGKIHFRGRELARSTPGASIREGMFYLPEERRAMGLFLDQSLAVNTTISRLDKIISGRTIDFKKEKDLTERILRRLGVKYASVDQEALSLSGGNQQKLLLGKCLFTDPRLLILDEPTKGIDVGSKEEIYELILSLSREGMSVIVISSEVEEIVLLSDRVLVMSEGKIIGAFEGDGINEHAITGCYLKTAGA